MQSDVDTLLSWDTGVRMAPESYDRMRAHPCFPEAVRKYARNMLASRAGDPALDGALKDAGRTMAAFSTAYLHSSGGLTLPRLKELLAGFGIASTGRARALLIYMHYLGFVEPKAARMGGQPAVYSASPRFLQIYRKHQRAVVDAIQVLEPAVGLVLDRFDAPGVFEAFVTHQGDAFLDGTRQGHAPPSQGAYYKAFLHRLGGIQTIMTLLARSEGDAFPPERPVAFSAAAAAKQFKVSRIHMRRVLDSGVAAGFIELGDGTVRLTPEGRAAVDWSFASQMIVFLTAAARTLKARPDLVARPGEEQVA